MSEAKQIQDIVSKLRGQITSLDKSIEYAKGKIAAWQAEGYDIRTNEAFEMSLETFSFVESELKQALDNLLPWVQRIQLESADNRKMLLTLLGLTPNSTNQEIIDAIDDIAPLFADYRRKKRGT